MSIKDPTKYQRTTLSKLSSFTPGFLFFIVLSSLIWRAPGIGYYYGDFDHGYPLSMGAQILLGKYPYLDFLSVYGPMTAWLTALSLSTGNLWVETFLCSLFYASTITVVFKLLEQYLNTAIALLITLCSIWLVGRFHKWFIWFFPIVLIYCYHISLEATRWRGRCFVIAGAIAGIGALFRLEFGLAYLLVFVALAINEAASKQSPIKHAVATYSKFFAGFSLILGVWLSLLLLYGGSSAIDNYIWGTLTGAIGTVSDWSQSAPKFELTAPFSLKSAIAGTFLLLPISYIICILYGAVSFKKGGTKDQKICFAIGIMGLAMFPHGIYRADVSHLHQTLACGLIAIPASIKILWHTSKRLQTRARIPYIGLMTGFVCAIAVFTKTLVTGPQLGWQPLLSNSLPRLQSLGTIEPSALNIPQAKLATAISKLSAPNDPILIAAILPQLYYFSQRRFSGVNPFYFKGIFDKGRWVDMNLAELTSNPPKIVVVNTSFLINQQHPTSHLPDKISSLIRKKYTEKVVEIGPWTILAPLTHKLEI